MKVTVTNYLFPIHFQYKGWYVTLNKKTSFFSTLAVEAVFTPPSLADSIREEQNLIRMLMTSPSTNIYNPYQSLFQPRTVKPTEAEYNRYIQVSNSYIQTLPHVSSRTERFTASNGLDNFMGSNTISTKKLLKKVENYMDANLPTIASYDRKPYKAYLLRNGVSESILRYISE